MTLGNIVSILGMEVLTLLALNESTFELAGRLYALGLRGRGQE